jgi:hypothetical protein
MRKRLALILLSCVLCVTATAQQPALAVGTATAVTGQTVTGFIEVSAGSDAGTNIPVAVIRGPKPGPALHSLTTVRRQSLRASSPFMHHSRTSADRNTRMAGRSPIERSVVIVHAT